MRPRSRVLAPALALALAGLGPVPVMAEGLGAEARARIEQEFASGRPDLLDLRLEAATQPEDLYPLALRDLWWRGAPAPEARRRYEDLAARAQGVWAERYRWLLAGGAGPYPLPAQAPHAGADPWPVLTTLVLDRQRREGGLGLEGLPDEGPLATREGPDAWPDYAAWRRFVIEDLQRPLWHGTPRDRLLPEAQAQEEALDERAASLRTRNLLLGIFALLLFAGGAIVAGRLVRPRDPGA